MKIYTIQNSIDWRNYDTPISYYAYQIILEYAVKNPTKQIVFINTGESLLSNWDIYPYCCTDFYEYLENRLQYSYENPQRGGDTVLCSCEFNGGFPENLYFVPAHFRYYQKEDININVQNILNQSSHEQIRSIYLWVRNLVTDISHKLCAFHNNYNDLEVFFYCHSIQESCVINHMVLMASDYIIPVINEELKYLQYMMWYLYGFCNDDGVQSLYYQKSKAFDLDFPKIHSVLCYKEKKKLDKELYQYWKLKPELFHIHSGKKLLHNINSFSEMFIHNIQTDISSEDLFNFPIKTIFGDLVGKIIE